MSIMNKQQLQNTRAKLAELEQLVLETRDRTTIDEHLRELTLRSVKKRINQFKEEIVRFEASTREATLARVEDASTETGPPSGRS